MGLRGTGEPKELNMTNQCKNCGKELKDKTSQLRGFGPECWNHALKKGVLEIPLVIRTSTISRDESLFQEACEKADLFITIEGKEVFNDGWRNDGSWSYGFVPDAKEFLQGDSMVHELLTMAQDQFDYGQVSICLWANKDFVPSNYMPERPANPDNLPFEFEGAIPILSFNAREGEVVNLVPKEWQVDSKEKRWRMVYDIRFGSGPLYTEIEDGMEYGYGGDGSHRHELISEWLCEGVGDAPMELLGAKATPTSSWLPTTNLESWVKMHPTQQFWQERKELDWLHRMMADRAIVVSFHGNTLYNILGTAYENYSEMWTNHFNEMRDHFTWSMILMSLEEGLEEIGDELPKNMGTYLRCNIWHDFYNDTEGENPEEETGFHLLMAHSFYDRFEKEYLHEYHMYNPIREGSLTWRPHCVPRAKADELYPDDPKWLRTTKWKLWEKFHEIHTGLWGQEYSHYSDYDYEEDPWTDTDWQYLYNSGEDAVGDVGLIHFLEKEVKESAELVFKWVMNLNANVFSKLGLIEDLDLAGYYTTSLRYRINERYNELVGN